MKIKSIGVYEIHQPTSGGKAGRNLNSTSSIQVREGGVIKKQFRFLVDSNESRSRAINKAKAFIMASTFKI